ncbi:MAG TPA: energy transducer TonB [Vicinamibacteria bacterium]|nr:energy transducer TonB [Vicinamibacteria bacterium]
MLTGPLPALEPDDALAPPPRRVARPAVPDPPPFVGLGALPSHKPYEVTAVAASALLHSLVVGVLLLAPLARVELPPLRRDPVRVLIYDPPPPPPPPLPLGTGLGTTPRRNERPQPNLPRREPRLMPPIETAPTMPPETHASETELPGGSPEGHPLGEPEGMEGGIVGGVVGGVPGGVLGGVIGGTGDIPYETVDSPDRPPRLLRLVKPHYPNDAFVNKTEGTVLVEIVIDAEGRVARARIARSVPGLDEAALQAVRQWLFTPGVHAGRPVATRAMAPVSFRIY